MTLIELPKELTGGRNLLNGADMASLTYWQNNGSATTTMEGGLIKSTWNAAVSTPGLKYRPKISLPAGTYTLSIMVNTDGMSADRQFNMYLLGGTTGTVTVPIPRNKGKGMSLSTVTFTLPISHPDKDLYFLTTSPLIGEFVLFDWAKLEHGSVATPFQLSPEDLGYSFPDWVTNFDSPITINEAGVAMRDITEQSGNPVQFNPAGVAIRELVEIPSELTGGRNLLKNSGNFVNKDGWSVGTLGTKDGFTVFTGVGATSMTATVQGGDALKVPLEPSTTYVFSAEVMYSADVTQTSTPLHYHWFSDGTAQAAVTKTEVISTRLHKANTWGRAAIRVTTKSVLTPDAYFRPFIYGVPEGVTVWVKNFKLEKGTEATPWSPAPEDLGYDLPHWIQNFDAPIQFHPEGAAVKEV